MLRRSFSVSLTLFATTLLAAERPLFSGPQVGEALPPFTAEVVSGDSKGESIDFIKAANGGPVLLVFFHQRTRPAFGLTNSIAKFANSRQKSPIKSAVVFLTDDPTEMRKWGGNVSKHFSPKTTYSFSPDGKEGPGKYGLNRNVILTILVGDKGKVTANFPIVQPQLQVDGPKIMKAIVDVTGGGEVPDISQLTGGRAAGQRMREMPKTERDSQLSTLLRSVINKQASDDEVAAAAKKVESYLADNEAARKELARIVATITSANKLSNYGTPAAQKVIQGWVKKYGEAKMASEAEAK